MCVGPPSRGQARAGGARRMGNFIIIWLLFEMAHLVAGGRYFDARARRSACIVISDTRAQGPHEAAAFAWSAALLCYYSWMAALLLRGETRVLSGLLLCVSAAGFSARCLAPARRVIDLFTLEGSIRIGLLAAVMIAGTAV